MSGMASGKRVEAHILVKIYWQPDFVVGRGPTQSIIIMLKGSSKAGMGCKKLLGWSGWVSYHLTRVAGFAVLGNIIYFRGSFMQTKHLCVLIHIWTKGKVGVLWNRSKPSSKIFLLTVPRQYFFCGSFVLFMSCVCHDFSSVHCCPLVTWRKGLISWLLFVMFLLLCYFPIWYPGTGVVLDCIDSWSLLFFLLNPGQKKWLRILW